MDRTIWRNFVLVGALCFMTSPASAEVSCLSVDIDYILTEGDYASLANSHLDKASVEKMASDPSEAQNLKSLCAARKLLAMAAQNQCGNVPDAATYISLIKEYAARYMMADELKCTGAATKGTYARILKESGLSPN